MKGALIGGYLGIMANQLINEEISENARGFFKNFLTLSATTLALLAIRSGNRNIAIPLCAFSVVVGTEGFIQGIRNFSHPPSNRPKISLR